MTLNVELIKGYVGEMSAAEKYLLELVKTQAESDDVTRHEGTSSVLNRLRDALERQVRQLDTHLETLGGGSPATSVKGAVGVLGGKLGALVEKVRSETASRMIRDTYSALSLVTVSYTMLHATALALRHRATAELALAHLNELTPFVVDLSRVVPFVVVNELADAHDGVDRSVGATSSRATHEAWTPEHVAEHATVGG